MKRLFVLVLFLLGVGNMAFAKEDNMKIKMIVDNKEIIVCLENNSATAQFLAMLPAEFTFRDFAGEEKVTDFPKPVDLSNVPRGMIAQKGKMFIYAPWGNLGIFYKNLGTKIDNSLIDMGTVKSGLENLSAQRSDFVAKIEIIE